MYSTRTRFKKPKDSPRRPRKLTLARISKKSWSFSRTRRLIDSIFLNVRGELQAKGDVIDILMRDHSHAPVAYRKVKEFREKWPLPLPWCTMERRSPEPARAWLDIRSSSTGHVGNIPSRLTADQLCDLLTKVAHTTCADIFPTC